MDPLFVASPGEADVADALRLWPELEGKRIRPLLVTAFGDIFVETSAGDVWVASPIELSCGPVAGSVLELERLFADPEWAAARLWTTIALEARDAGIDRAPELVFAVAPHPILRGSITTGSLKPMTIRLWHDIARQIREQTQPPTGEARAIPRTWRRRG